MTLKERAEAQAKKQMFDMAMSNPTDPFADFEVRDNLKWAYEAGFREAIRLAAEALETAHNGRVALWGTEDAVKVIRALAEDSNEKGDESEKT